MGPVIYPSLSMESSSSHNAFVFSDAINSKYIIDLYAGDYVMIEETFADVLHEYDSFVETILTSYHEKNIQALKSAIHKIKPLFGFVGLTGLQTRCLQFENSCMEASEAQLAQSFSPLEQQLLEARAIIEKEKIRLTAFNNH
jgi:HPt (histidine-containing phosphotransfer) domain-containing protein